MLQTSTLPHSLRLGQCAVMRGQSLPACGAAAEKKTQATAA